MVQPLPPATVGVLFKGILMVNKQELKQDLKLSCSKGKLSKTQANRKYIEELTGEVEHIYRGELPYPKQSSPLGKDVLDTNGQVMYLYTVDWNRR